MVCAYSRWVDHRSNLLIGLLKKEGNLSWSWMKIIAEVDSASDFCNFPAWGFQHSSVMLAQGSDTLWQSGVTICKIEVMEGKPATGSIKAQPTLLASSALVRQVKDTYAYRVMQLPAAPKYFLRKDFQLLSYRIPIRWKNPKEDCEAAKNLPLLRVLLQHTIWD